VVGHCTTHGHEFAKGVKIIRGSDFLTDVQRCFLLNECTKPIPSST